MQHSLPFHWISIEFQWTMNDLNDNRQRIKRKISFDINLIAVNCVEIILYLIANRARMKFNSVFLFLFSFFFSLLFIGKIFDHSLREQNPLYLGGFHSVYDWWIEWKFHCSVSSILFHCIDSEERNEWIEIELVAINEQRLLMTYICLQHFFLHFFSTKNRNQNKQKNEISCSFSIRFIIHSSIVFLTTFFFIFIHSFFSPLSMIKWKVGKRNIFRKEYTRQCVTSIGDRWRNNI